MARRAKSRAKATYTRIQRAKDAARVVVGQPPPTRVQPDPKKKRLADPRYRETFNDSKESDDRLLHTDDQQATGRRDQD